MRSVLAVRRAADRPRRACCVLCAGTRLSDADYAWLTAEVAALNKPIVSVLEGGYNVDALEKSVRTHIKALIHS